MKKTVKSLIIASSVAAIAGIGAVSFAAWEGSGKEKISATGSLGTVNTVGFSSDTALTWDSGLVPKDQPAATIKTGQKLVKVTLPQYSAVIGQKITVEVKSIKNGEASYSVASGKKNDLYVMYSESASTTLDEVSAAANKYESGAKEVKTFNADAINTATSYLYFALDSTDELAQSCTYTIEVQLAKLTA